MIEHYDYIMKHWKEYDLTDTQEEFKQLLNILEAMGENIDSLHNTVFNGYTEFWDCCCSYWETDRELVKTCFYFGTFFDVEGLKEFLYEQLDYCKECYEEEPEKGERWFYELYFLDEWGDEQIIKTRDGYVLLIHV